MYDELLKRITIEAGKCGGRPCIRGIRIRVLDILEMLGNGGSTEEILADFPDLEPEDIRACLLFAAGFMNRSMAGPASEVLRINMNIASPDQKTAKAFFTEVLGMRMVMDLGFIATFASDSITSPQISVASEGGAGVLVPDYSVEVADLDGVHARAVAVGLAIEYGPIDEPWGVRRFYVRDPFGRIANILTHDRSASL